MILEVASLNVRDGMCEEFEAAFERASKMISSSPGFLSCRLQRCIETPNRYVLLVEWRELEDHTEGFRGSEAYGEWSRLLHRFYDPFPEVLHFESVYDVRPGS